MDLTVFLEDISGGLTPRRQGAKKSKNKDEGWEDNWIGNAKYFLGALASWREPSYAFHSIVDDAMYPGLHERFAKIDQQPQLQPGQA